MKHKYAVVNGIKLHYVEQGKGKLVILIHGFPEYWGAWKKQISFLATKGYRVIAPDMRGYNLSAKPKGINAYDINILMKDVEELIKKLSKKKSNKNTSKLSKKAIVIGHDWGGLIAWFFGMNYPHLIEKLIILNCPHPSRIKQGLLRFQMKTHLYFFFQFPLLPELVARFFGARAMSHVLRNDPVNANTFSDRDIEDYLKALDYGKSVSAPINYYRAAARTLIKGFDIKKIIAPVLVLWGTKDIYLANELAQPDRKFVPNLKVKFLKASHWVQNDNAEEVNQQILGFLKMK